MGQAVPNPPPSDESSRKASGRPRRRGNRSPAKLLDSAAEAAWIINSDQELVYLNTRASEWLGGAADALVGRKCHPAAVGETAQDAIVASLAAPLALRAGESIVGRVEPPGCRPADVRFIRLGEGAAETTFAFAGAVAESESEVQGESARRVREHLEQQHRLDAAYGAIAAVGTSRQARRLRRQMQLAAAARQHLAVVGPRGSGGEAIARRIHALTLKHRRPDLGDASSPEPAVVIDMPLMDAELLDSALSPAAAHLRSGDAAATLILRELDESPADVQQRLVDFATAHSPAVRIIALTALSPTSGQAGDRIIDALSEMLSVFELAVAPPAERVEDIPLIAAALLEYRNVVRQTAARAISDEAMDLLITYPWPNRFDELAAAVRHAADTCRAGVIGSEHLPLAVRSFRLSATPPRPAPVETDLDDAMRTFELEKIRAALEMTGGNRSEASRLLGISRARLIRRLADHGLGTAAENGTDAED